MQCKESYTSWLLLSQLCSVRCMPTNYVYKYYKNYTVMSFFLMKHLNFWLSCLVSSMENPSFSEQIDNICRNCFILVSKTAVDTFNETLAIFWHTSIDRLSFWWSVLIITFFGVIFETLWVIFNALKDFSSKNGWWFLK